METWHWLLLSAAILWLSFNWVAPFAILVRSQPLSPGRLPHELFTSQAARAVKFYTAELQFGYGYSVWAPPWNMVLFDHAFFQRAHPDLVRFVVAHELAHFTLGHHRKRWLLVVLGLALLPQVQRMFVRFEHEADAEAARRTGFPRSAFPQLRQYNPIR